MNGASPLPWIQIVTAFKKLQELCQKAEAQEKRVQEAEKARQEASKTPGLALPPAGNMAGADLVALRAALRSCLLSLKEEFTRSSLTEMERFHVLIPLTLYTDELARTATQNRVDAWPPLQRELLECDDGGVRFYKHLDGLLAKEETLPLIFEVFYLCLNGGFVGQYRNNPGKLEEYKQVLLERIPVVQPVEWTRQEEQAPAVELVAFPKWYYAIAAAAVLGMFVVLHLLSRLESLSAG